MWQPIETAPQDKVVLTFDRATRQQVVAVYSRIGSEWCAEVDCWIVLSPSHWMPLLANPE